MGDPVDMIYNLKIFMKTQSIICRDEGQVEGEGTRGRVDIRVQRGIKSKSRTVSSRGRMTGSEHGHRQH